MEIIIDESEAEDVNRLIVESCSQHYWKPLKLKKIKIEQETLQKAQREGRNYLEILVKNILNPDQVKFRKQFKELKLRPLVPDVIIERPGFTNIVQSVRQYGSDTTIRFRYPVRELLEVPESLNQDWYYALGKDEEENVFLLLCPRSRYRKPTVSKGVKIPSGR